MIYNKNAKLKHINNYEIYMNELAMSKNDADDTYFYDFKKKPASRETDTEFNKYLKNIQLKDFDIVPFDNDKLEFKNNFVKTYYRNLRDISIPFNIVFKKYPSIVFEKAIAFTHQNRIHFYGLSPSYKGFGFAYKVYQKTIETFGYIKSNGRITSNRIKSIYYKLLQNDKYYHIYNTETTAIILIDKKVNLKKIINVVKQYKASLLLNFNDEKITTDLPKNIITELN